MRIRTYNDEELKELIKNPNVLMIKNKSRIEYKNTFKYWAVMQKIKYPEKTAREIFENAGFNMNILSLRIPQRRISYWLEQYKKFGIDYFLYKNEYRYSSSRSSLKTIYDDNNDIITKSINKDLGNLLVILGRLIKEIE